MQLTKRVYVGMVALAWFIAILYLAPTRALSGEEIPALRYFPLFKYSVWTYQGPVMWIVANSGEIREKSLTIQMTIADTYQRGGIWFARFQGHPSDAVWYEEEKPPAHGAYLCIGSRVYELDDRRAEEVLRRLQNPKDSLVDLAREDELLFDFPLLAGKRFGEKDQLARSDGRYHWMVLSQSKMESELLYDTLPAHIRLRFEEGKGVTYYEYVHHGTVSEAHLDLIGFTVGNRF